MKYMGIETCSLETGTGILDFDDVIFGNKIWIMWYLGTRSGLCGIWEQDPDYVVFGNTNSFSVLKMLPPHQWVKKNRKLHVHGFT